jgi:hypothetical protein
MKLKLPAIALIFSALSLTACTTLPTIKPDASNPIRTVALLPLVNNSTDVDGPIIVRSLLAVSIGNFFYAVKPLEETDQILKEQMGVTLGSQLDMATTKMLCENLGTDGIMYGSLEDFSQKITGIYNSKRVRLRLRMDSCKTGKIVWKNGIGVKSEKSTGKGLMQKVPGVGTAVTAVGAAASVISSMSDKNDADLPKLFGEDIKAPWEDISDDSSSAEVNLFLGLGGKIMQKALDSPLLTESETAIEILLNGYYDDGADLIPCGTMCPLGPVAPKVTQTPSK